MESAHMLMFLVAAEGCGVHLDERYLTVTGIHVTDEGLARGAGMAGAPANSSRRASSRRQA